MPTVLNLAIKVDPRADKVWFDDVLPFCYQYPKILLDFLSFVGDN